MSERVIGINEIKSIVPFRPPYLMVDRAVVSEDGMDIRGAKAISANELFFCGHFPKKALMPGVLQVEAMTQLGLIASRHRAKYAFVREASRIKFRAPVTPGDVLDLAATITEMNDERIKLKASAKVAGQVASQANLVIDLIDDDDYFRPTELPPKPKFEFDGEVACDIESIREIMPHRFPFQLVDRVLRMDHTDDGRLQIFGMKNVTFNEPYFASIKNEMPFMPNYLSMEIAAQLGCIRKVTEPDSTHLMGLYLGVDKAVFHKAILPGDSMYVRVTEESFKGGFGRCAATIYVGEDVVAEMAFKFALTDKTA